MENVPQIAEIFVKGKPRVCVPDAVQIAKELARLLKNRVISLKTIKYMMLNFNIGL